jgi:signal transduction histidine kinase
MKSEQQLLSEQLIKNNARFKLMAEIGKSFAAAATDYDMLLDKVAYAGADLIGDGCIVTLIDEDGLLSTKTSAHRDPKLALIYKSQIKNIKISAQKGKNISAQVVRSGKPVFGNVKPEEVAAKTDDALKALVLIWNVHSFIVVPIQSRHATIGTLTLVRSRPGQEYAEEDVSLLQDVATRAGLTIEIADLYMRLEERVKERTRELEFLNKELESFSYSVAHDLRAPLRSIDGCSQILKQDAGDRLEPEELQLLDKISASVNKMNLLIEDMLTLSGVARSELTRKKVNLSDLVREICTQLQDASPDRQVAIEIQPEVTGNGDVKLLEIALTNLLSNAWKFTRNTAKAKIEFGTLEKDSTLIYFIKDNGAGFDQDQVEKIFAAFERLHEAHQFEGTGIGLSIVQRIILRHHGTIWAEGLIDQGATFYFTLK